MGRAWIQIGPGWIQPWPILDLNMDSRWVWPLGTESVSADWRTSDSNRGLLPVQAGGKYNPQGILGPLEQSVQPDLDYYEDLNSDRIFWGKYGGRASPSEGISFERRSDPSG